MTAATIFRLVLLGLVFLIWAFLMFRMLGKASAHQDGFLKGLGQLVWRQSACVPRCWQAWRIPSNGRPILNPANIADLNCSGCRIMVSSED